MNRRFFTRLLVILAAVLAAPLATAATTYYIRTDGGSFLQCTGKVDAKYPGSGSNQACAWHHPFDALPPNTDISPPTPARIAGGDTVIIEPGSYEMGLNAPGAKTTYPGCNPSFSYDCHMQSIPSGTAAQPTRILGQGWDSGCSVKPQLWGSEHSSEVILMQNNANVQISCLEITDHSACIESHFDKNVACNRSTPPYGNWASHGIYASNSSNVKLTDLDIHGMANRGILNGKLSNWSLTRVHIVANGWSGWDGDLGCGTAGCSSDSGNMTFQSVEIAWNGCTEQYPTRNIYACWAQTDNGYGDGFGTAQTGGNWTFTDSYFHHNTSDGLDLLYADSTANITVERSRSEGNAGNQMKIAGTSLIENSVIVGNCSYFQGVDYIVGNNSNSGNTSGDNCRAYGNALVVSLGVAPGATNLHSTIRYNSITSEGNCLILAINGSPSASVQVQNNLLVGAPFWIPNDGTQSCLFYWDAAWSPVTFTKNFAWKVKPTTCPSGSNCSTDPQVADSSLKDFDPVPLINSPLISAASTSITVPMDYRNLPRPGAASTGYDIGAVQYQGLCDDLNFNSDNIFAGGFEAGELPAIQPCVGELVIPDAVVPPHP
jgi:hypothetical protein